MESLFEQVENGRLWSLTGGIHPPSHKEHTSAQPISQLPIPKQLIVPLKQHIGVQGKLLVSEGDTVLKGQPLTSPVQGLSLPVHAPTSGKISKIEAHPIAHPSALSEPCIFIEPDGEDSWVDREPLPHYCEETPEFLVEKIKMAGISGLGGAGFPAYVKSKSLRNVNYLIVNATECEPYITADDTLIQRDAQAIIQGIDIVASIVNPNMIIIGIEDDKPAAIECLKLACAHRDDSHIRVFPSKYPSGGEKQLINILTGQQVPSGGIAIDIGILVHNIGTLHAIYKAVVCDEPLISRIVTVTGGAVKSPQNLEVLVGTPIIELLKYCDFSPVKKQRVIMGGPMMGFT
ncbi:MAG: electron transport complex subunit RsxC, partial [Psychrosphaera sp.]|nr:electron transport complex subunit RsxC [Psychrosphaera sp.]